MFDIIFKPLHVLFDSTKKLPNRIFYFSAIVVSLFFINDYTGFIRNYKLNSELGQLKTLKELGVQDTLLISRIKQLTTDVLDKESAIEQMVSLIYSPSSSSDMNEGNNIFNWSNYSASFIFVNIMVVMLIFPFLNFGKGKWFELIVGIAFMEIIFGLMAWGMIKLLGMIPEYSNPNWNIVVNFSINIIIIAFVILGITSSKSKKSVQQQEL